MKNNALVAEFFVKIAELLEIKGDNPFRIRAYLRAAEIMKNLKEDMVDYIQRDRLEDIAGIGHDLAEKIKEIFSTGQCHFYDTLKKDVPEGVLEMLEIPSVGPKTARLFYEKLKIKSISDLKKAAAGGRLFSLPGIKEKTVENIIKGIDLIQKAQESMDLLTAEKTAQQVISALKKDGDLKNLVVAGSFRRMKEVVRDIDILVVSDKPKKIMDSFVHLPFLKRVLAHGGLKSAVLTQDNAQVDLRVFKPESFGAALLYFTGSKNHNIRLRQLAIKKGLKINEYGLFDKKEHCLASKQEKDIYKALGLVFIPPELREDAGEIEAALKGVLPRLIDLKDIRGDFHVHTNYSDGVETVEDMVEAARRLKYDYVCLSDHSVSLKIAGGLDKAALKKKKRQIDQLNSKLKGFRVLFGSEVEINADGSIDYDDGILADFDIVIAAIHTGFKQSKKQLTKRILKACENKHVHMIAHPTGRLWPARGPYELDFKEIFKIARDTNTALEINAHPYRLDLNDQNARLAKENGVKLAINTDSHNREHLSYMKFGVGIARRAWLEKKDILNTLSLKELLKTIKK